MQPQMSMPGMGEAQEEKPLPVFRRDLELYRAPDEPDGSPTYSIFDPVSGQFFKISWAEATLLRSLRPGMTMSQLLESIEGKTTLKVESDEIGPFFEQAMMNNLLAVPKPSSKVIEEHEKKKVHPLKWLLFHYLYFRVPLFNPDKILEKTLPYAKWFVSPIALIAYAVLTTLGVIFLLGRLDQFFHTFPYFFSLEGAAAYSITIVLTKIAHEMAHGYTAKHFKIRVPMMGIAVIFLMPVLYTDITDSWKMDNRTKRLGITAAGVIAELIIAGICTLGWAVTEPGILQSVFFVVSSVSWVSTLLVNVNPAMRFDGYYLFSDFLGVDNLQMRAFNYTRWRLRKDLLGLDVEPPEEIEDKRQRYGMYAYTIYTWIYRLFLYTAIAIMVYTQFTKVLGVVLFFIEVGVFFVWPAVDEVKRLIQMKDSFKLNRRLTTTLAVLGVLLCWVIVPLPHTSYFPAVTNPMENQVIYVPKGGTIESIFVERGEKVVKGQPLAKIFSKKLEINIEELKVDKALLETEINILSGSLEESKALIPEKMAELASIEEQLVGLEEQKKQNTLHAQVSGRVYEWDDVIVIGQSVYKDQILGRIGDLDKVEVVCYVPEDSIGDMQLGKKTVFHITSTLEEVEGKVTRISPVRVISLPHPQLGSLYEGPLPVVSGRNNEFVMIETYYPVTITINDPGDVDLRFGKTGEVIVRGKWKSKTWELIKRIWSLFWEESSF